MRPTIQDFANLAFILNGNVLGNLLVNTFDNMLYHMAYQAFGMTKNVGVLKAGVPNGGSVNERGKFLLLV